MGGGLPERVGQRPVAPGQDDGGEADPDDQLRRVLFQVPGVVAQRAKHCSHRILR